MTSSNSTKLRPSTGPTAEKIEGAQPLFTERDLASLLNLSVKTLRNWRLSGYGPPHLKVGRLVRYRVSELNLWLKSCERASSSDRGRERG
jgi:predicted DNA-binding transcriptional regulator AlpA